MSAPPPPPTPQPQSHLHLRPLLNLLLRRLLSSSRSSVPKPPPAGRPKFGPGSANPAADLVPQSVQQSLTNQDKVDLASAMHGTPAGGSTTRPSNSRSPKSSCARADQQATRRPSLNKAVTAWTVFAAWRQIEKRSLRVANNALDRILNMEERRPNRHARGHLFSRRHHQFRGPGWRASSDVPTTPTAIMHTAEAAGGA